MTGIPLNEEERIKDVIASRDDNLKNSKLKELNRKLKTLFVKYEREVNEHKKLQKEFLRFKTIPENQVSIHGKLLLQEEPKEENLDWKKKYFELEKILTDARIINSHLKKELLKAQKVIEREIGKDTNLDSLLKGDSQWRGRAQTIELLKAKIHVFREKYSPSPNTSTIEQTENDSIVISHRQNKDHRKLKNILEEISKYKEEIERLKGENSSLNDRFKALAIRKNIVEKEIRDLKDTYGKEKKILLEKCDTDDKYIAALKQEVLILKSKSPVIQTKVVYRDDILAKRSSIPKDETSAIRENSYLKEEILRKEQIIKELIQEKMRDSINVDNSMIEKKRYYNTIVTQVDDKVVSSTTTTNGEYQSRLEEKIHALKKENGESTRLRIKMRRSDMDSSNASRDLSLQDELNSRQADNLGPTWKAKNFTIKRIYNSIDLKI